MSSFKPASYSTSTPPESSEHQQRQPPLHHQYSQPHHQQQQQQQQHHQPPHQQDPHSHMNIFEMPPGRSNPHAQFMSKKPILARIEGEDEELEVIGSGISGSFEPMRAKRLPLKLPNLNYNYPESSVQNFSPGTSLIFNAYKGHSGLLTQPYMAPIEDVDRSIQDNTYQRIQSSLSQEIHSEQPSRQHLTFPPREVGGHSSYPQQHSLEHSPYRASYERQYHPYQANGHPRDSGDYREYRDSRDPRDYGDPREYEDSMSRSSQRSPRMSTSTAVHRTSIASPSRTEQNYGSQPRISEHSDLYRPREEYPPHPSSYSQHPSSQPPPQNISPDTGRHIPLSSHSTPPTTQNWRRLDNDHPNVHHPYDGNNRYQTSQSQLPTWDNSPDHKPPTPSAAIDIPQPRNRGSAGYANNVSMHDSMDTNMRNQHHQSQYAQAGGSMGSSSFRGSFGQRPTGPRYSLSRVNYRMIFEYASEIRECLIKGKVGSTDRLLYNAEILSKVFLGCRSDIDPNAPVEEEAAPNPHQLHCTSCNIVKTPEWRKGPLGPRTLCNACGLIWGKMSRSKAALVAKSKQGSTSTANASVPTNSTATTTATTTNDVNMTDAMPENQGEGGPEISPTSAYPNSAGGLRKRGREMSSTADADDEETLARDEDRLAIERSRLELEASHLADSDQLQQAQSQQLSSDDTTLDEQARNQTDYDNQTRSASNTSTDSSTPLTLGGYENQSEEVPAVGRKLALSFLLA